MNIYLSCEQDINITTQLDGYNPTFLGQTEKPCKWGFQDRCTNEMLI